MNVICCDLESKVLEDMDARKKRGYTLIFDVDSLLQCRLVLSLK